MSLRSPSDMKMEEFLCITTSLQFVIPAHAGI